MIDVIKQTPSIYSEESRDYQVVARLYSALFNVSKMYVDNMHFWDNDIDNDLAYLRAHTLNFKPKHTWDLEDLEAITASFKYLVKNKGTKAAFEYCINILMKVHKLKNQNVNIDLIEISNNNALIRVEENLVNIGIVEDLVKYILPAGITYRIIPFKAADLGDDELVTEMFIEVDDISTTSEQFDVSKFSIEDSSVQSNDILKGQTYSYLSIITQPKNTIINKGETASIEVYAFGIYDIQYQWQWAKSESTVWSDSQLESATSNELKVPGTSDRNGQQYRCKLTDSFGNTIYSDPVVLTVVEV